MNIFVSELRANNFRDTAQTQGVTVDTRLYEQEYQPLFATIERAWEILRNEPEASLADKRILLPPEWSTDTPAAALTAIVNSSVERNYAEGGFNMYRSAVLTCSRSENRFAVTYSGLRHYIKHHTWPPTERGVRIVVGEADEPLFVQKGGSAPYMIQSALTLRGLTIAGLNVQSGTLAKVNFMRERMPEIMPGSITVLRADELWGVGPQRLSAFALRPKERKTWPTPKDAGRELVPSLTLDEYTAAAKAAAALCMWAA